MNIPDLLNETEALRLVTEMIDHMVSDPSRFDANSRSIAAGWSARLKVSIARIVTLAAVPPMDKACVCGEPQTLGTVHRTDGPCYRAESRDEREADDWDKELYDHAGMHTPDPRGTPINTPAGYVQVTPGDYFVPPVEREAVAAWRCTKPALATVIVRSEERAKEWREYGYTCEPLYLRPAGPSPEAADELYGIAIGLPAGSVVRAKIEALAARLRK